MIVKIQRPLMTTEEEPKALVYNEDRSLYAQMPFQQCKALFERPISPDNPLKIYVEAELVGSELRIGERVPNQGW